MSRSGIPWYTTDLCSSVRLYGVYLVTDNGDISLEWIGQTFVLEGDSAGVEAGIPAACLLQAV